jgi:hypothetical protein
VGLQIFGDCIDAALGVSVDDDDDDESVLRM